MCRSRAGRSSTQPQLKQQLLMEEGRAAALVEEAAKGLLSVGANAAAARALVLRAELLEGLEGAAQRPAEAAELAMEAEASRLQEVLEVLQAAARAAEAQLFAASPRALPAHVSLPAARALGRIKARIAEAQLRVEAATREVGPSYPLMAGRDAGAVRQFVRPPRVAAAATHMPPGQRATLSASSALALSGASVASRAAALLGLGLSLLEGARKGVGR